MSDKKTFVLVDHARRRRCADFVLVEAPEGSKVTIGPAGKTRDQEERAHAMIGDIAKQFAPRGNLVDAETMKRLCVDQFRRDTAKDPDFIELWASIGTMDLMPSLDGSGIVAIGWQTRRFPKRLYSAFIEWLFALGAENSIVWSEPV